MCIHMCIYIYIYTYIFDFLKTDLPHARPASALAAKTACHAEHVRIRISINIGSNRSV